MTVSNACAGFITSSVTPRSGIRDNPFFLEEKVVSLHRDSEGQLPLAARLDALLAEWACSPRDWMLWSQIGLPRREIGCSGRGMGLLVAGLDVPVADWPCSPRDWMLRLRIGLARREIGCSGRRLGLLVARLDVPVAE